MKKVIFILVIIIAIAGLLLFRVPLIQKLTPEVAKYYGFDVNRLEVSQLDVDKIVVPMLALQQVDGSIKIKIEIHNLVVDIDTYKAELSAVSSSYVYIDVEDIGGTSSASNNQRVKDVVNLLPIFGISIEQLDIKYHAQGEELLHFDGQLLYTQKAALKGVISRQDKFNFALDVSVDDAEFFINVSQKNDDNALIALMGDYQLKDDWLDVSLKGGVSFSAVNKFLQAFGIDDYVQQDESNLKAKFELDLTRSTHDIMQSFVADIDIDSRLTIALKQLGVKQAKVDVSASCRIERIDTSTCSFKNPQRVVVAFYQIPEWVTEYFNGIEDDYVVEINPNDQLTIKLSLREILYADIKGDASVSVHSQTPRLKVNVGVSNLNFSGIAQEWELDANYEVDGEVFNVSAPVKISRFLVDGRGKLTADQTRVNIHVDKSFAINALNANYDRYEAKNIRLEYSSDAQFVFQYQNNRVQADDVKLALVLNQVRLADVVLEATPIQLHFNRIDYSDIQQKVAAKIDVNTISLTERGIITSAHELTAQADLMGNEFSIEGDVALGKQKQVLKFSAGHDLAAGLGRGAVSMSALALANNEIISNQISESGFPLQLKGGSLGVDVNASWSVKDSTSEMTVKLLADQIMGDYAQNQFFGFNTALEFVEQGGWSLKWPADIKVDMVNLGVPVKDVSVRLERMEYGKQEKPLIRLSDLSASVLEGSVYSEAIEIDLNRRENKFVLQMSSLSLEKLIALNQTEDLEASGTLNGKLPMRLDNGVLLIDEGWLRADETGGYIKYGRIGEVLAGNDNLQLVGEMLKDFRYNQMSAQVDLLSEGRLMLATKLHGRNPSAELNKQVNLNFNIDFNLWKFLESARLLTRIDQDITKQILSKPKR